MNKIEIKKQYENELKLRNYSRETVKSYISVLNNFLNFSDKISNDEVKRYLLKTINEKKRKYSFSVKSKSLNI